MAESSRFASSVNDATLNSLDSFASRRKPRAQSLGESAYGVTGLLREHLRLKRLVTRLSVHRCCKCKLKT